MITRISGRLEQVGEGEVTIVVGGLGYQVWVSPRTCASLRSRLNNEVVLHTICYFQGFGLNQLQPVLLGFEREQERAFFQLLTTVDGLGPKAALRLLTEPVERIAAAIEGGDEAFLRRLPGIGRQKAGEIIAKLRGKAAAFAGGATGAVTGAGGPPKPAV
ncbi:MAG TPA: Holliday junction branch migration protein RuvA, partial [Bacillota bacterium]